MMTRALIGGCLLAVLMLRPAGAAAQAASSQGQDANTGNDLFRPPPNLFQMMYGYKTAPGSIELFRAGGPIRHQFCRRSDAEKYQQSPIRADLHTKGPATVMARLRRCDKPA
jgi:hypothetical protein